MKTLFKSVAFVAILTLASCGTVNPVNGKHDMYSLQEDVAIGQKTLAENVKQMRQQGVAINADRARLAQIQEIVTRITKVCDYPDLPYNVTLFQTNIVNAAAAPGGSIMVFAGLYDPKIGLVKDDDEMAAVLAHEIAHVNCRHTTEQMTELATATLAVDAFAIIVANRRGNRSAEAVLGAFGAGTALLIPSFTRPQEAEADHYGLFYMAKAGYDPRAAPRIWKRAMEAPGSKDHAGILATHPSDADRYKALTKLVPQAMEEYAKAVGHYPPDYKPGSPLP